MHIFGDTSSDESSENILTIQCDDDWYKEVKENIGQDTMLVPKFEGYTLENDI
jgi:hypothetical protein